MKYLIVVIALCFSMTTHAEVLVDQVLFESNWQEDYMVAPGEYACPGGTMKLNDMGFPYCDGGKGGLHIRGTEAYSCLGGSVPDDPRVEGTLWMLINSNYDADYTGPGWGVWRAVPSENCEKFSWLTADVYWEGSWEGTREIVSYDPTIWVHTVKIVGHGVGGELEGQKFTGTEVLTLFTPMPVPYELLPWLDPNVPESVITAEIKSKD